MPTEMWIADAARCREIDRRAIQEFGVPSTSLMERAGEAVFEALQEIMPTRGSVAVYCGRGNNGGDGFVVARHAIHQGHRVHCVVAARMSELSPDSAAQLDLLMPLEPSVTFCDDPGWSEAILAAERSDAVVDALLGTGAAGEARGPVRQAIEAINGASVPVVSVDVPSGIDTDSGGVLGVCVRAVATVTFGLPKPCFFQGMGAECAGDWRVAEIGFPTELLEIPTEARVADLSWARSKLPLRRKASHKGDNGRVLIVAGSRTMPGAAVLAARGALRAGTGLVIVAGIPSVCVNAAHHIPEALLLPLPEEDGVMGPAAYGSLSDAMKLCGAAVIGPGLTTEPPVRALLQQLFQDTNVPYVVDADALNGSVLLGTLPQGECVLTPHPGEMGRLLGTSSGDVQARRFEAAREAVDRFGKTVLLKGAHSVVGSPGSPLAVNVTGNPGMAAGGMGDVLSGVVGALLAQGLPAADAATLGMVWHGLSGDLCAEQISAVGFSASEVADRLPQARARILASTG